MYQTRHFKIVSSGLPLAIPISSDKVRFACRSGRFQCVEHEFAAMKRARNAFEAPTLLSSLCYLVLNFWLS